MQRHPRESDMKGSDLSTEDNREPELRKPGQNDEETPHETSEENLDKTIEDSFPASDPPSSIPDPDEDEDAA